MRANRCAAILGGAPLTVTVLVGASLTLATAAQAQSVWGGPASTTTTQGYKLGTNWDPNGAPVAAGQSAIFKNSGKPNVNVTAGPISPDSWTFNSNSKSFTITGADVNFSLAGAAGGIINKANTGQTISISNNIGETLTGVRVRQAGDSTLILSGVNTYSGNTTISAGTLQVTNNSSVGTGNVILDGGLFQVDGLSNLKFDNKFKVNAAGGAIDANGATLTLSGKISDGTGAGPLTILDTFGGGKVVFTGTNTYTGGTTISDLCNCATLQLGTAANSGSIIGTVDNKGTFTIVNSDTSGITTLTNRADAITTFRNSSDATTMTIDNRKFATLEFRQGSSAGDAVINNHISAGTTFFASTAGNATINNLAGLGIGVVEFNNGSTAGSATINNAGLSWVVFNDKTKLEGGKIVNTDAGLVLFNSKSSAGNVAASITNNGDGQVHFLDQSMAGSATITNNDFGVLGFHNRSSADNAIIVNGSANGMAFLNQSTAGNAFITTNNNSGTFFLNRSDGGTARFETEAGSIVDFSASRGPNSDGRINAGSIAGGGNYFIGGGNTLVVGGNDRSTEVSGVIADNNPCGCTTGPGALEKVGLGTMILSGTNTYTGGTTITDGTLQLGNGGASGSIPGDVVNNSALAFNRSDTYQFDGVISGSGAVQQDGAGTTILTALQSYSGVTTITGGTLALAAAGNIASSSGVIADGAFDISGVSGPGSSIKTLSGSGSVALGAKTLTLSNASGNFAGAIGGSGGFTVAAGTQTLSGVNGYTGATTISGGTLALAGAGSIASSSGVVADGAFDISGVSGPGSSIKTLSGSGSVALGAKTLTLSNASGNFAGAIGGSGGFTVAAGTQTLSGVNGYTGATTISSGTLALAGAGSIASSSGVVANGGFDISGTTAGASIKNLSGAGIVTLGAQTLTLTDASGTFAGAIGGNGDLVKQGAGLFILSGTNTYTGATTVAGGDLRVNGSVASAVTVQSGATLSGIGSVGGLVTVQSGGTLSAGQSPGTLTLGALNLNTGSTSVFELGSPGVVGGANNDLVNVTGNLTLGGTLSVNAPSAGYYRLFNYGTLMASSFGTINGSSNGTPTVLTNVPNQVNLLIAAAGQRIQFWDGADQTGNGVVNGGAGTWNAANTNWTGAPGQAGINDQWRSSVGVFAGSAGTVTIAGAQAFDTLQFSTTGYVLNAGAGGQLQLAGLSGTGTINTDNGVVATIDAPIVNGSSTSLTKVGGGTLVLTAANTYSGGTTISGGTLQIGNGGTTGSIVGNVTDNGIFAINRSNTVTFGGTISGSGAFQQLGSGTTTLTADNNYTGGTTIGAGTLQLGNGGTTGSIVGNVTDNGVFAINRSNTVTFGGTISGSGAFQQLGTGTTTLTADNNYSGGTTIGAGTLQLGNGGATGSIVGNVLDNGVLAVNRSNALALGGVISGSGAFQQLGSGTTTLSGANTYTGATSVFGGTLTIAAGGSITSDVTNNATFNNSGSVAGSVTNAATFNNNMNGTVSGLLTNTGITTNAGQLNGGANVSGGTLTNNNLISGPVGNSGGFLSNNLIISGTVTNDTIFNNNAGGTVSGLLTNTGGSTINAGQFNGGASVTGGALTTTGTILNGLTNNAFVNAAGGAINGAIANNAGGTFNVLGTVTSDSTFTNAASATLAIGASGAYTLQGLLTNSGAITVASGGQLTATVGGIANNAGGTITVALGGTVNDDLNNAGAVANSGAYLANVATNTGTGGITNTATGAWTGNVLSNAAAIGNNGSWTGNVASNTGTIDNNKTWTGTVSNAGTFNNNAGATVSGLLTNTAGTTTNNGALNGGANVSGGTLAGSGTVANLSVSGGIFAPGNGTPGSSMTVAGNLAFQSGALYLVQLNPATSTFANVTGTAALNGGAGAAFLTGNYVAKQYTILTAAGGVSGTFGSFDTLNIPNGFRASLSYDASDVFLNLDLALAKYSGLNVNQQNVANALTSFFNATGGIPAVFGTLTPGGLTQVSGELATGTQQTTFDAMNLFLGLLTDPFVAGRGNGATPPTGASQFAEQNDAASAYAANGKPRTRSEREAYAAIYRKAPIRDNYDPRWSVWATGYGGSQTTDGSVVLGSNNTRSSIGGVAVGADYLFSPRTLAGFALAGGGTNFSVNGLGTGRSDLFQAGAFVRHAVGPAYVSGALAYGWQDITTDRTVTIAGADLLRAKFNADAFSSRVEGGYRFVMPWMAMGLTPYAAGQFATFDLPAYAEQAIAGANTFALNYTAKDVTASRSELGLRADKSFAMQNGIFTLRGRAAWAHNYNPDRNIAATFQTLPGASFVVNGAAQARDAALVTASAEMKWLNGFSLAGTFEGEFSGVTTSYAGKGVVRYAW